MNKTLQILIASDHAGFYLKQLLIEYLKCKHYGTNDLGAFDTTSCDYPLFAQKLSQHLFNAESKQTYGILVCATGIGMTIAANRHRHVRAALCFNEEMATLSREHNNANVIVFGAKVVSAEIAIRCVSAFLAAKFEGGRHERRLQLIEALSEEENYNDEL